MKKNIYHFLLFFALCVCFSNDLFASTDPIPGVDVIVRKPGPTCYYHGNPCPCKSIITTGKDGSFDPQLDTGSCELTISYEQVVRQITSLYKKIDIKQIEVLLSFDNATDLLVNGQPYRGPIKLSPTNQVFTVAIKKGTKGIHPPPAGPTWIKVHEL